ncbi:hypothetical protein AALO_G00265440 [Alosa alosa]|uniref:Uncharacterized protein n=1 Tax=Alosa alosa TaxID=278164 RepID=A0AAV6FKR8_9TELE|nr:hypothetical protein AALO_G00265440 [Alosa alosa]
MKTNSVLKLTVALTPSEKTECEMWCMGSDQRLWRRRWSAEEQPYSRGEDQNGSEHRDVLFTDVA